MSKIRRAVSLSSLAVVAPLACAVTPIDAVTELDGAGSGSTTTGTGGSTSSAGSAAGGTGGAGASGPVGPGVEGIDGVVVCEAAFAPAPGEYFIVSASTGTCMAAGDVTLIEGAFTPNASGYEVRLDACAPIEGQRWRLSVVPVDDPTILDPNRVVWHVEARNVGLNLNLDMEAADPYDGTRALLYMPHEMENQRFEFTPNGDDLYMISPLHVDNSCLQAMSTGIPAMYGCNPNNAAQQWQLASESCAE